ncbi:MAG: Rrf2 family transcriptional regulator [Salinibacter sp.]
MSIETVSEALDIGFSFLTKVFQQLNEAGLLTSKRGPGGGVALTRPPGDISLYEIVVAIDGTALFEECVLGLPGCGEAEPCPLHEHWTDERERMKTTFQETTLAEVPDVRLTPFLDETPAASPDDAS